LDVTLALSVAFAWRVMTNRRSFPLLVLCLLAIVGLPATAAAQFSATSYYHIKPRHAVLAGYNLCLDVENASPYDNARIQQYTCNPTTPQDNQLWTVVPTGSGTFRIVSAASGKCLDVLDPQNGNGAAFQQYTCNLLSNQANQVFNVTATSAPGYYRITSTYSGGTQCLDVPYASLTAGQDVQQWTCGPAGQSNQDWQIVAAVSRTTVGHVKHFGWYGEAIAPTLVNDHANLIVYTTGSLPQVATAAQYGIKARLALVNTVTYKPKHADTGCNPALGPAVCDTTGLFANHGTDGGLRPDICQYWSQQRGALSAYMPHVATFYLDEPLWNLQGQGWNPADSVAIVQMLGEVVKGQSALCSGVTTYPQDAAIPFSVVEAYGTAGIQQPQAVDWVGFDCYGPFNDCNGPAPGITPWMDLFNAQKAVLRPHQKLVVVPSAHVDFTPIPAPQWPNCEASTAIAAVSTQAQIDEAARSSFYLTAALAEPKVVAVWPWHGFTRHFQYTDVNGNPIVDPCQRGGIIVGGLDLPIIKNTWRYLARSIGFGNP
jgi:Ricin-type beta-trefoil lectin domain-like